MQKQKIYKCPKCNVVLGTCKNPNRCAVCGYIRQEIDKCSKCAFAIPNLYTIPLKYGCFSPYDKGIKCKLGIGE